MQAILLAAGRGLRLRPYTEQIPKTLLEIHDRAIIDYILGSLDLDEIDEIIVVGGFQIDRLEKHLEGTSSRRVRLVDNPEYADGSVLTIEKALPFIHDSFLLLNGDHIHPREMIRRMVTRSSGITCACDSDRQLTDDDMKIKLRDGVVWQIDKKLTDYECGYIGMTFCHLDRFDTYRRYIDQTREQRGTGANVEAIIQQLADGGERIEVLDCSGLGWIEVDTAEDLERASVQIRENSCLQKL
jgi:choline kinase